jgi:formylglycine-generating enzyme required for sulfatase activity
VDYSTLERAAKWVMRNKALSAVIGIAVVALMAVGGVLILSVHAQKIALETGKRVTREAQASAARAAIQQDRELALDYLAACKSAYRKAAAPLAVEMEVVPPQQSVRYLLSVERGPMTSRGRPFNESAPDPELGRGARPPGLVRVLKRKLGMEPLKEATENGSLATIFADRAEVRAKAEGFTDLAGECKALTAECRLANSVALSASGDIEKAIKDLGELPNEMSGRGDALAYARGLCPLTVTSQPPGARICLLSLPAESVKPNGKPLREGDTPVDWTGIPAGTYILSFKKDGYARVDYHLRLRRDLPDEAAHELAVWAGREDAFAKSWNVERRRLSGQKPCHRRVNVNLLRASRVPSGFIVIPAGSFIMGEEKRPVFLETYLASETELSAREWREFFLANGAMKRTRTQRDTGSGGSELIWRLILQDPNGAGLPAATMSWDDSRAYLRWINVKGRDSGTWQSDSLAVLPTEAIWEKAARGVDGRTFPWGEVFVASKVNGADLRPISTTADTFTTNYDPVNLDRGTSVFGLKHAGGNIWEWCLNAPLKTKGVRILKGGCFSNGPSLLRLAGYNKNDPSFRPNHTGFRMFIVFD